VDHRGEVSLGPRDENIDRLPGEISIQVLESLSSFKAHRRSLIISIPTMLPLKIGSEAVRERDIENRAR
jgi:hypothetical protein